MAISKEELIVGVVKDIGRLTPGDDSNMKMLETHLRGLSAKDFEALVRSWLPPKESGLDQQNVIPLYEPMFGKGKLTIENNLKVAKQIGHQFYHRLRLTNPNTGRVHMTATRHLVADGLIKRQIQLQSKKESVPKDDRVIDEVTGQVTGESKGSKISFPELQALGAQNLVQSIQETMTIRGGNAVLKREWERQLMDTGRADMTPLLKLGYKPKSTLTLSRLFTGMQLGNNIAKDD